MTVYTAAVDPAGTVNAGAREVFGRQQRALNEAMQQLRLEVTAELRARDEQLAALHASLLDAVARASDTQAYGLHQLRLSVEHNNDAFASVIEQLARTCAILVDSLEVARADRTALAGTLGHIVESSRRSAGLRTPGIRGQFDLGVADVVAERCSHARGVGSEVWCRFQNRWIGGFEIADVVDNGDDVHYRLRRSSDGYVLPSVFSPEDVRAAKEVH